MASRVNHINKNTGITYVYESVSYWDKEKKQARNKQTCLGKLDPISGELIPSKRSVPALIKTPLQDTVTTAKAEIVGSSIILDAITERLGLRTLLKSCFPKEYSQILTMAYYLASRGSPLSHCGTWCKSHAQPFGEPLIDQRITEVLRSITIDSKQTFFNGWMKKVLKDDYL